MIPTLGPESESDFKFLEIMDPGSDTANSGKELKEDTFSEV